MFFYRIIFIPILISSVLGYFDENLVAGMKNYIRKRYRDVEENENIGVVRNLESERIRNNRENVVVDKIFNALARDLVLNHRDLTENNQNINANSTVANGTQSGELLINGSKESETEQSMPVAIWNYLKNKLSGLTHSVISLLFKGSQNQTISTNPSEEVASIQNVSVSDHNATNLTGSAEQRSYYYTPEKLYGSSKRSKIGAKTKKNKIETDGDMMNPDGIDDSTDLEEDPEFWEKLKRLVSEVGSRKHTEFQTESPVPLSVTQNDEYSLKEEKTIPQVEKSLIWLKSTPKPQADEAVSLSSSEKLQVSPPATDLADATKEKEMLMKMMNYKPLESSISVESTNNKATEQVVHKMENSMDFQMQTQQNSGSSTTMYSHWNFKDVQNGVIQGTPGKSMKLMGASVSKFGSVIIPATTNSYVDSGDYRGSCVSDPELCSNGISIQITFKIQSFSNNTVESIFDTGASSPDSRGFGLFRLSDGSLLAQVSSYTGRWCARYWKSDEEVNNWVTATLTWNKSAGLSLFVNCRLISTSPTPGTCSPCTDCHKQDFHTSLTLGRMNNGLNPTTLSMHISDFEIHDNALSIADVAERCGLVSKNQFGASQAYSRFNQPDSASTGRGNSYTQAEYSTRRSNMIKNREPYASRNNMFWKRNMARFRQKSDALYNIIRFDDISQYGDPKVYYMKKRSV